MKQLFVLLICSFFSQFAFAAPQQPDDSLFATRQNFVSLNWNVIDPQAGKQALLVIAGNTLTQIETDQQSDIGSIRIGESNLLPPTRNLSSIPTGLSNDQIDELLETLNFNHFWTLAGGYRQKNIDNAISETLSVTISDKQGNDHTVTVQNYGNDAPAGYTKVRAYLQNLQGGKFAPPSAETLITPLSFVSLRLSTAGGIASSLNIITVHSQAVTWEVGTSRHSSLYKEKLDTGELLNLLELLQNAYFVTAVGTYLQPNIDEIPSEQLTLALRGQGGEIKLFTIVNHGNKAPSSYYRITAFLRALQEKKIQFKKNNPHGELIESR